MRIVGLLAEQSQRIIDKLLEELDYETVVKIDFWAFSELPSQFIKRAEEYGLKWVTIKNDFIYFERAKGVK